ncbi:MAG: hypothetical protein MUE72_01035 [Chitinophagaceae bacterium]|jgi:hypothetical protein|nr:hypothetical protein [Chitinophagaceae bacterium]
MNFDKHLATYLYEHQFISLPGIGEFRLDNPIRFGNEEEKKNFFPSEGIHFTYNRKATTQPEFVQYIRSFIAKPVSLIESDVEDYALQIVDWLNIGKPYTIEGIGTLTKLQTGQIEFSLGVSKIENISSIIASIAHKESSFEGLVVETNQKSNINIKRLALILATVLIIGLVIWGVSFYVNQSKQNVVEEQKDTLITTPVNATEIIAKPNVDTGAKPTTLITDTVRYKMYFLASKYKEKTDKLFAYWSKLEKVNRDELLVNDTMRYRLFIYKKAVPKDTAIVKKKLAVYFKHAITIELAQ